MPPNKDVLILVFKELYRYRNSRLVKEYRNDFYLTQKTWDCGCRYKSGWLLNYRTGHDTHIFDFKRWGIKVCCLPKKYFYSSGCEKNASK